MDDLPRWLAGSWVVERTLTDRRSGSTGTFVGALDCRPGPGGLDLVEDGQVRWGGHTGRAGRRLRALDRGNGTVEVTFADGRHFHLLDLRDGSDTVIHPCAEDRYDGRFTVEGPHRWRSVWEVTGPTKDQCVETVHVRQTRDQWVAPIRS